MSRKKEYTVAFGNQPSDYQTIFAESSYKAARELCKRASDGNVRLQGIYIVVENDTTDDEIPEKILVEMPHDKREYPIIEISDEGKYEACVRGLTPNEGMNYPKCEKEEFIPFDTPEELIVKINNQFNVSKCLGDFSADAMDGAYSLYTPRSEWAKINVYLNRRTPYDLLMDL